MASEISEQRFDQWLVFARFVKTRSLATQIISHGQLRINGKAVNKSHFRIKKGDEVSFIHLDRLHHFKVLSLPQKRISPPQKDDVFCYMDEVIFVGDEQQRLQRRLSKVNIHKGKEEYSRKQNKMARELKYKLLDE